MTQSATKSDVTKLTRYARTRLPEALHQRMAADAAARHLTHSKLIRAILAAHYTGRPIPKVKANGAAFAVARELNRIGVNLNQLTHVANATQLVPLHDLQNMMKRLETTLDRL